MLHHIPHRFIKVLVLFELLGLFGTCFSQTKVNPKQINNWNQVATQNPLIELRYPVQLTTGTIITLDQINTTGLQIRFDSASGQNSNCIVYGGAILLGCIQSTSWILTTIQLIEGIGLDNSNNNFVYLINYDISQ